MSERSRRGRLQTPRREERLRPPRTSAFSALGPYARTQLTVRALGQSLALDVPGDVFSTQRIDEGTLLLLSHLPEKAPGSFLDLGCGYGALGLPIAARHPGARALLVDRDLLAVHAAAHNAQALGLANVRALPGLGYRDLPPGAAPFDQVLCNVPARIGERAIAHLLEAGRALLAPGGEVRVVVIRDLVPSVEGTALPGLARLADGPRHSVFALPWAAGSNAPALADESIYDRDRTALEIASGQVLELSRPHDVSEEPSHARALSLLFDALPRVPPRDALVFRAGYGRLALGLRTRYPQARIVAQDRDLLDTTFLRRNAAALSLDGPLLEVRESLFPAREGDRFALVVGELNPGGGPGVAARELAEAAGALVQGGHALILLSEKQEREWLPGALPKGAPATVLLRREGASVLRISRS